MERRERLSQPIQERIGEEEQKMNPNNEEKQSEAQASTGADCLHGICTDK